MNNIVSEMDALAKTLEVEKALREAATTEYANGTEDGPMRAAHDEAVATVIARTRVLLAKVDA